MTLAHKVFGYDKRTEKLAFEFEVPDDRVGEVRELIHAPASQAETFGSFAIDQTAAWRLAWRLQLPMNVDYCDWFFEPVAEAAE